MPVIHVECHHKSGDQMKLKIFITTFLLFFINATGFAQTTSFKCEYPTYSDEKGNHKVTEKFVLQFVLDSKEGKAYTIGTQGSSEVSVLKSAYNDVNFIEITATGNVMRTAVTSTGISVHSRNTVMSGEIVPSQYYGKCNIQ